MKGMHRGSCNLSENITLYHIVMQISPLPRGRGSGGRREGGVKRGDRWRLGAGGQTGSALAPLALVRVAAGRSAMAAK